jgi:hypothetical protein
MNKPTFVCLAVCAIGCSAIARSPEQYRDDTQALLETKNADIKKCYDEQLKTDAKLSGQVTVKFTVKAETGKIVNPEIDPARTTAPAALGQCVTQSIDGLALQQPDEQDGQATFTFDFTTSGGGAPGAVPGPLPGGPPAGGPAAPGAPAIPGAPPG